MLFLSPATNFPRAKFCPRKLIWHQIPHFSYAQWASKCPFGHMEACPERLSNGFNQRKEFLTGHHHREPYI